MSMNFKSLYRPIIFSLLLPCMVNANTLPKGNSAWLYGKKESWIQQIQDFNSHTPASNRFNYLFPETGIIHIDSIHDKLLMSYDPSVTKFYKQNLKNVVIIADLSFWVAHTNFKNWPVIKYQKAADQIAALINNDPNADGVFLDLETYSPSLLPFYRELVKDLKSKNKILSVIIRPGEENVTWFKALGNNAFVVLYGYDLHMPTDPILPVSPKKYQQRLMMAVNNLMNTAKNSHMPVMGGIPVVATTYEWEQKIIDKSDPNKNLKGAYRQIDYFKSALYVYNQIHSPLYLGLSVWAFISDAKPQIEIYLPFIISSDEWDLLRRNY